MFQYRSVFTGLVFVLVTSTLTAGTALSQTTAARPDRGTMPQGSYSVSDIENISLQNGNVNLNIPLASLPPIAGGMLSWTINAHYNSKMWDVGRTELLGQSFGYNPYVVDDPQTPETAGWRITQQYALEIRDAYVDFNYQAPDIADEPDYSLLVNHSWYKVIFRMPDGSEHELRPTDYTTSFPGSRSYLFGYFKESPYTHGPMRYYSFDGSHLFATVTSETNWTVYLPTGLKIVQTPNGIQRLQDPNGNKIKIFSDANGTHYQDEQTGREIRYTYDPSANNNQGQGRVWYRTVGNIEKYVEINFGYTTVQGQAYRVTDWKPGAMSSCPRNELLYAQLPVIREIVLPVTEPGITRKFTFSYNSDTTESATNNLRFTCDAPLQAYTRQASKGWGSLSRMTTPSGAIIDYSYELDSGSLFAHSVFAADDISDESITQKKITHDGVVDIWTYQIDSTSGSVTGPDGSTTTEAKYEHAPAMGSNYGKSGLVYRTSQPFKRVEKHWTSLVFSGANTHSPNGNLDFNSVVDAEYTTLLDGAGNAVKMSARTYVYDYNGNVRQTTEYDWFDPALVARDAQGVPTGVPATATVLRTIINDYYHPATTSSSSNVYAKRALTTATPLILNGVKQTTSGPAITQISYDGQSYGAAPTIGNITGIKVWSDLDSKWISGSQTYNSYGNVITRTDAKGKVTQFYYDDATQALPNRVVVDPQNGTGTQTTTTTFDFYTGVVTSQRDANDNVTTIDYTNQLLGTADPFARPGVKIGPLVNANGVDQHHRETITYLDNARQVIVAADLSTENDKLLKTRTTSDMLGRVVLTEQTENGTSYTISVRTVYDLPNRTIYTSNPMRATAASTDGWTRTTTDALGRTTAVATFAGASQPSLSATNWNGRVTTSYDANKATATDQAGKTRRSELDAVGQLRKVVEDPSGLAYETNYTYDVLGNLRTVVQGVQTRTFTYDSLSRLRTEVNPESGTITYTYDDNGNLLTKQDGRPVTTTLTYDALNRPTSKTYSDNTPRVDYFYDTQSLPAGAPTFARGFAKGRLIAVTYGGSSNGTYRGYDARGSVLRQYQRTDAVTYLVEASYSLNGSKRTETFPAVPGSGDRRTVNYLNDNAGRMSSLTTSATSYGPSAGVNSMSYSASGGLRSQTYGNNLIHGVTYNSRQQTEQIKLGTASNPTSVVSIAYTFGSTGNNGNILSMSYNGGGLSYTETFAYDQLNRLTTSQENGGASWSQTNGYDRFGNRWINLGGSNQSLYFNSSNNRITGASYDGVGNLLQDGYHTYTYDGENRVTKIDNISAYVYDGEGRRVRRLLNGNLRFVYGVDGQLIAQFSASNGALSKEFIYGSNGLVATIEPTALNANGTRYSTPDHLGSPRVITNSVAGVVSRHDYMPYGEELGTGIGGRTSGMGFAVNDGQRQQFTSKERDFESGLDYFGARYYSSAQGRFTTTDPLRASAQLTSPQSWNRYQYVDNNPLTAIDPDGLSIVVVTVSPRSAGGDGGASVSVYDRNGNSYNLSGRQTNQIECRAVGQSPNRQQQNADTPFGVYVPFADPRANQNGTQGGVAGREARHNQPEYGTGILYMDDVSGEVTAAGRSTIYIHGGGRPLSRALEENQPLTATLGCVRCYNGDINALVATINELANSRNDAVTNIFIGDTATLNTIADETLANGDYRYPELRRAGFGTNVKVRYWAFLELPEHWPISCIGGNPKGWGL